MANNNDNGSNRRSRCSPGHGGGRDQGERVHGAGADQKEILRSLKCLENCNNLSTKIASP